MTNELKPCPFCGSPAELVHSKTWDYFVRCTDKGCAARTRQYHENETGAVNAWNARAATTIGQVAVEVVPMVDEAAAYWRRLYEQTVLERTCHNLENAYGEFECSNCGFWADFGNDLQNVKYCPGCGAEVWQ